MVAQRKVSPVWQNFDKRSDNKVVCWLCEQKLAYIHFDVKVKGEQAATNNIRLTSITKFAFGLKR